MTDKNIINSFITSSPIKILKTIKNLYIQNKLFSHILITLKECIIAFILTGFISFIIAILMLYSEFIAKVIAPYLIALNSLPKVALGPIIIIWIGANQKGIIIMALLISLIVSIQNLYNGFKSTDKLKIKLLKTFNASKLDILLNVIIPYNKENIYNTFKINLSMCLIGVIMGEFLTSKAGIGYLILYGSQVFNLDLVMSGIFILSIISILLYFIINIIKKVLI
jgi:NitT/TauT family transport system permease protein